MIYYLVEQRQDEEGTADVVALVRGFGCVSSICVVISVSSSVVSPEEPVGILTHPYMNSIQLSIIVVLATYLYKSFDFTIIIRYK